jgi:hypothetical protein
MAQTTEEHDDHETEEEITSGPRCATGRQAAVRALREAGEADADGMLRPLDL